MFDATVIAIGLVGITALAFAAVALRGSGLNEDHSDNGNTHKDD